MFDDENLKRILKAENEYRKQAKKTKRRASSKWTWFFDENPFEIHLLENPRSTERDSDRLWFRAHISWSFLARLQTDFAAKLAIVAALIGAVLQGIPGMKDLIAENGNQFGYLYFTGMLFILSILWFHLTCPALIKYQISKNSRKKGMHHRQLMNILVEREFGYWRTARHWPSNLGELGIESKINHAAEELISHGYKPHLCGFGAKAHALIEYALFEFSNQMKCQIWQRSDQVSRNFDLRDGPQHTYESHVPFVKLLRIRRPDEYDIKENPGMKGEDILISWDDSVLSVSEKSKQNGDIRVNIELAEGLYHFFENDNDCSLFSEIISEWQQWRAPWSRAILILFYIAMGLSFMTFLIRGSLSIFGKMHF